MRSRLGMDFETVASASAAPLAIDARGRPWPGERLEARTRQQGRRSGPVSRPNLRAMHRLLTAALAATALATALAGCSASDDATGSSGSGSPKARTTASATPSSATTKAPSAKPWPVKASKYPAAAKRWINENICIAKAPSCKLITRYGMIGGYALVAYTRIHPDGDAATAAQPICSWLLGYIVDQQPSADAVSSDAYVYGSTGSRVLKCHTPVDRS